MATLYLLLVLVLTSVAADSILDMIDTKAVERIVAERRANSSREFLLDNNSLLEEETTESILRCGIKVVGLNLLETIVS